MGVCSISDDARRKSFHVKIRSNLININNKYIFQKIFDNITKLKTLKIIKYNKKIQKRLNINIKDYKEYPELYSPIEIEIKPADSEYDTFINIPKEDELYYHIYFNNNKEEIKRNKIEKKDNVKIIKIIIDNQVKSFSGLFEYCYIKYINFKKFYRNNIFDMSYMFTRCYSLKEINLSNFNTNNVTNMEYLFFGCYSLKELNLSNFNTNNVTDMNHMFYGCYSLKKINLSNFNTNNVIGMNHMFFGCSSLKELNLYNFNTNNVTNMHGMFFGCSSLKELNLSNFNTSKVTDMFIMFYECSSLKQINLHNFNIKNVTNINSMFYGCSDKLIKNIKAQMKNIKNEAFLDHLEPDARFLL